MLFSMVPSDRVDSVSIQYLSFALKSDPDNQLVRYLLARQLYLSGQYKSAKKVLNPLLINLKKLNISEEKVVKLYAESLRRLFYNSKDDDEKKSFQQEMHEVIRRMNFSVWSFEALQQLVQNLITWAINEDVITLLKWQLRKAYDAYHRDPIYRTLIHALFKAKRFDDMVAHMKAYYGVLSPEKREDGALWLLDLALASGDPDRAWELAQWMLRRTPDSLLILDRAIDIASQVGQVDRRLHLMKLRLNLKPDPTIAWELFNLMISSGRLQSALELVPMFENHGLTLSQIRRVAQVYEWAGQPEAALSWWIRYARRVKQQAVDEKAWRLAIGVYRFDLARQLLEQAAQYRLLTAEETRELVAIYMEEGNLKAARRFLELEVSRHGQDPDFLFQLYAFYMEMREYDRALELLKELANADRLKSDQWLEYVSLLWLNKHEQEALMVLRRLETPLISNRKYWELRLDLSLYLGNYQDAYKAFQVLVKFEGWHPETQVVNDLALGLVDIGQSVHAARLLLRYGDQDSRLLAISIMIDQGDVDTAQRWLTKVVGYPEHPKQQAVYWSLRARVFELRYQKSEALKSWGRALSLDPGRQDIHKAFLWSLIANVDTMGDGLLKGYLDHLQVYTPSGEGWTEILAYGYTAIGEYERALFWFRKGLRTHQKDIDWLLTMAEAFDLSGFSDYADRLRRHVWTTLMVRYFSDTLETQQNLRQHFIALTRRYGGSVLAHMVLRNLIDSLDMKVRIETLMEHVLAGGHIMLAQYYYAQAWHRAIHLPGWEKLGYGLMVADQQVLDRTLQQHQRLPRADRVVAINRLGATGKAVVTGLADLKDGVGETVIGQIRRAVVSVRAPLEHGIRVGYQQDRRDIIDIDSLEFQAGHLLDGEQSWGIRLWRRRLRSESVRMEYLQDQFDVSLFWKGWEARQHWQVLLVMQDRVGANMVAGAMVSWFGQRYQNLRYGMRLYHDIRPQISGVLWGWGLKQGVETTFDYDVDGKMHVNLLAGWRRFTSIWREPLGGGSYGRLAFTYRLWMGDPVWDVESSIEWFTHASTVPSAEKLLQLFITPPDTQSVLPSDYGRIGLRSSWYHGQLHRLAHVVPSPRWIVSTSVGYQWVRGVMDYGMSAGLGWRIRGDDELALTFRWGTDSVSNAQAYWGVRLTYNVFWGR